MEFVATVIVLASTYALLAAGIVIVYKASRVINFAHGEFAIVGGYVFFSVGMLAGGSVGLAVAGAFLFSLCVGLLTYAVLMRRLVGEPFYVGILVTVGLAILLKAAIIIIWKAQRVSIVLGDAAVFSFPSGGSLSFADMFSVTAAVAFYLALFLFFRFSRLGIQFRGTAENPLLASQRRVNVHAILALAWAIAVFAACLSGVLYGSRALLGPESVVIGLSGLTAALVGGLDSLRGALLGALIVAFAEYTTVRLVDPILSEAVPFFILLLVMSVRPWGLFGTKEEFERV
ncbi:MAG: branched-chain amino acid ABC transporter permease [Gammaproteobacteria bacterium]|nr:branched-chain amino acid ABC transporter permease [Gammaproteobacteria bacterium]NIR85915.1 branched-chain amino acid ABC transporter permease [Gammaproteobacteria bacterium]NIR91907.1 branched-chain amino acid ABC transporter permease [Gammaproteobacteria bacterium]NIU07164.1 branched-chain amino acid ABC transporter permease [Gammaproteobacteria bacterium]NIV53977.1 hypothetical protein [Gammaproteobacteria bacterium]